MTYFSLVSLVGCDCSQAMESVTPEAMPAQALEMAVRIANCFGGAGRGAAIGLAAESHAGFVAMAGEIEAGVNDHAQDHQHNHDADQDWLFHRPTAAVSVKNEPILRNLS